MDLFLPDSALSVELSKAFLGASASVVPVRIKCIIIFLSFPTDLMNHSCLLPQLLFRSIVYTW